MALSRLNGLQAAMRSLPTAQEEELGPFFPHCRGHSHYHWHLPHGC